MRRSARSAGRILGCALALLVAWPASAAAPPAIAALRRADAAVAIGENGLARLIVAPPSGMGRAADAHQAVAGFLQRFGAALGAEGRVALRTQRAEPVDEVGMQHVRLQQAVDGVPVAGGEVTVHLRDGAVTSVLARTVSDLQAIDVAPSLSAMQATAAARRLAAGWPDAATLRFSDPQLQLFNRALIDGSGTAATRLAWFVEARGPGRQQYLWIDAVSGAVLRDFNQQASALRRQIYDAGNRAETGPLVRGEGEPRTGVVDADLAYDFAGDFHDYLREAFGRDSYDGAGAVLALVVRACLEPICPCPCPNAFSTGESAFFGAGYMSDDIVAHELTHNLIAATAHLFYTNQSGALNESYADIFGETIDLRNGRGNDTPERRWWIGEDIRPSGVRDMADPNRLGAPASTSDPRMICDNRDLGGVHTNSGISNHAFALLADGGTYHGVAVAGIGVEPAARIHYRALTAYLTSTATFADQAAALRLSCGDLAANGSLEAAACAAVDQAIAAVEMDASWPCDTCAATPRGDCWPAASASFGWRRDRRGGDRVSWLWRDAVPQPLEVFGDPRLSARYNLCIYADGDALQGQLTVAPDAARWRGTGDRFQYRHPTGNADGVSRLSLVGEPRATIALAAEHAPLTTMPPAPLSPPVRVQLVGSDTQLCFESVFAADAIAANGSRGLRATSGR